MAAAAILVLLGAMGCGWVFRRLLLGSLRSRHPGEFAALGQPSSRQLASLLPRHQELHLRFWKYVWGGKAFLLHDRRVSSLAGAALISDVAVAGGFIALLWFAAN